MQKDYQPYISGEFTRLGLAGAGNDIRDLVAERLANYNAGHAAYANQQQDPADVAMDIVGAILVPEHLSNLHYDSKIQLLSMLRTHLDIVEGSRTLMPDAPMRLDRDVLDTYQRLAAATPFPTRFLDFIDNKAADLAISLENHTALLKEHLTLHDVTDLANTFADRFSRVFGLTPPLSTAIVKSAATLTHIQETTTGLTLAVNPNNIRARIDVPQFLHTLTLQCANAFLDGIRTGRYAVTLNMKEDATPALALHILLDPRTRAADGYYSHHIQDDIKAIDIAHKVAALTIDNMGLEDAKTGFETWGLKDQPVTTLRGTAPARQPVRR